MVLGWSIFLLSCDRHAKQRQAPQARRQAVPLAPRVTQRGSKFTTAPLKIEERGNLLNLRVRRRREYTPADQVEEGEDGPEDCELHGLPVLDQPVREGGGLQDLLVALLGDR